MEKRAIFSLGYFLLASLMSTSAHAQKKKNVPKEEETVVSEDSLLTKDVVIEKADEVSKKTSHLKLNKGTIYLNGGISFNYEIISFLYTQHLISLEGKVGAGYFIEDFLVVGANIPAMLTFFPGRMGEIGLSPFATYFFDIKKNFFPYVGGEISPRYSLQERAFSLSAGFNAGIILPLGENVALDFGMEPTIYFKFNNLQKWRFKLPVGFLGIKAFF